MERKVTVVPLTNVVPEGTPKTKRYVFAMGHEDYTNWTLANLKLGASEQFVFVQSLDDVKDLRNITYAITKKVEEHPQMHKKVNEMLAIINFSYADKLDEQVLPKCIQELMNEMPDSTSRFWQVGDLIKTKSNYPPIGVEADKTIGIIYHVVNGEPQIIFENGEDSGWSKDEAEQDLQFLDHCYLSNIEDYHFVNIPQLVHDYEDGLFAPAFAGYRREEMNKYPF